MTSTTSNRTARFKFRLFALFALAALSHASIYAQKAASNPAERAAPAKLEAGLTWAKLSSAQQLALKPIEADWSSLDATRKKKWLAVAQRYASLPLADQAQMHSRMQAWSQLSPAQRQTARDNYTQAISSPNAVPTDGNAKTKLSDQWVKYQALPPEKRAALQAAAESDVQTVGRTSKSSTANDRTKPLSPN